MALVDPNIALSYKPLQVADPVAQYGRMAAIENAQAQNQLAQARLMEQNRLSQEREAMNALYSSVVNPQTGAVDYNALISGAAKRGLGSQIPGITKQFRESEEATNKALRSRSELIDAKLKQSRQFLENINPADPNAPQLYMRWHEANHADPVLGPMLAQRGITADQSRARIEQAIAAGPAAFTQMLQQSILGIDKFTELNRPVTEKFDLGGAQVGVSRPGLQPANYYMQKVPLPTPVEEQKDRLARASRAQQTVYLPPGPRKEQEEWAKILAAEYKTIASRVEAGRKTLPALESSLAILDKGFDSGFGTEAKTAAAKVLGALGIEKAAEYAANSETFLANAAQAVLQRQLEQKGPQTEADAQRITQTSAQLGNTKKANRFLLKVAKAQIKRDMAQKEFYRNWQAKYETLNGAEAAWEEGPGSKSLFDSADLKEYASGTPAGPTGRPSLDNIFKPKGR